MHQGIRVGLLLFPLALAGCSKSGPEKFIPAEGQARQALETALTAWKSGQEKPGSLKLGKVGIEVVDATWSSGQKLSGFEIVSEEPGQGPRFFIVKLTLAKGPETVKYVVLGNDPLWVYTEAAYNKLSGPDMIAPSRRSLILLALVIGLTGCARSSHKRFIPAEEAARTALLVALESWQNGEPHGAVPGTESPVVHFVDSHHKPEQRLKDFEVQTMAPGEGPRVFTVRLKMENPAEEVRTRYVVVGLDPVWVLRQEDYDMVAHWEHPMKKP